MDPSCHLSCPQVATLNASFILSSSFHLDAPWTHLGLLHFVSELDGSCCHLSCFQVATLNASFMLSCSLHLDAPWTHLGLLHLASELDGSKLPPQFLPSCHLECIVEYSSQDFFSFYGNNQISQPPTPPPHHLLSPRSTLDTS